MKDPIKKNKVDHIDLRLGCRLKARRVLLEMSAQDLGVATDISSQQITKYEKGIDRIPSTKLLTLSQVLRVPVLYFFDPDDENNNIEGDSDSFLGLSENLISEFEADVTIPKELLDLIRSFCKIKGAILRKKILGLIREFPANSSKHH